MDLNNGFQNSLYFRIIACILIISSIIYSKGLKENARNWNFKGPVQKIWYDVKGVPFVTVRGREYNLYNVFWHFNIKIHTGDTIIKNKGDRRIKMIFRNSKDTIYFNDREF
jgi:hypothetical protein